MSEQEARVELAERLEAWGRLRFYPFRHSTWAEDQQVLREAAQLLRESSPPEPSRVIPPSLDTPLVPGQVSMRDVADAPEPSRVKDGVNPRPWEASPGDRFVDCFDCGFVFSAEHTDDPGGGYTCPLCASAPSVRQEGARVERLIEDTRTMQFGVTSVTSIENALAHINHLEKALREIAERECEDFEDWGDEGIKRCPDWCASDAEQCPSCMARTALKGEDDA